MTMQKILTIIIMKDNNNYKSDGSNSSKIDKVEISVAAKHGLLGQPTLLNEEVVDVSDQNLNLKICTIPKKNLRVDSTYQRPLDEKKVRIIKANWHPKVCDLITVFSRKLENGMTDNLIVDGQHRASAYPSDKIRCRVIEDGHPIIHYLLANDSDTKSTLAKDAVVWNVKQALDMGIKEGYSFEKFPMLHETVDIMNSFEGFECCSVHENTKNFGAKFGKIYLQWRDNVYKKLTAKYVRENKVKRNGDLPPAIKIKRDNFALKIWQDTLEIMVSTFGSEAFTKKKFGGEFWTAVQDYLFAHKKMKYDISQVIDMFADAPYRDRGNTLDLETSIPRTLQGWNLARKKFDTGRVSGDYLALIKWVEKLYKDKV